MPKAAGKTKTNSAFMKPMQPSEELAEIVGSEPLPRSEVTKKIWAHIKKHKLQNPQNKREILADDKSSADDCRIIFWNVATGRQLHTPTPHSEADRARAMEAACNVLLNRYGVVFRDLLARETLAAKWRDLLFAFRRLEARGEVRGGRFVSGFTGEQFGLPIAVESLRAMRNREPSGQTVTLSAADPLNLVGIILPGERVPAISGRYIGFRDGVPIEPELRPLQMAAR